MDSFFVISSKCAATGLHLWVAMAVTAMGYSVTCKPLVTLHEQLTIII